MLSICFLASLREETLERITPSYFCKAATSLGMRSGSTSSTSTCWARRAAARACAWLRSFSAISTSGRPRNTLGPQGPVVLLDRVAFHLDGGLVHVDPALLQGLPVGVHVLAGRETDHLRAQELPV